MISKSKNSDLFNQESKINFLQKIKKMIRKNRKLYFLIRKPNAPFRYLKNKDIYHKHYTMLIDILNKNNTDKKVFYIGVPTHSNLGDQAQYLYIKHWIKYNFKNYSIIEIADCLICRDYKNIIGEIKKIINDNDVFIFQSGYRTTDVCNFDGEHAHQMILNNFKNKVIVFPQTVNFKLNSEKRKSIQAYKNNDNYVFMARDRVSYEIALSMYDKKRILLYPDVVTALIGNYNKFQKSNSRNGILFCLRNDDEKLYANEEYNNLINRLKNITGKIGITDTNSNENFEFDRSMCEEEFQKKLQQFASYRLVITDRFHGTIFSLISNTPVIVLNSTDHKLSSGVNWFKGVYDDYVYYCNDLDDVYEQVNNIYNKKVDKITTAYFQEKYYDRLLEKISNILK